MIQLPCLPAHIAETPQLAGRASREVEAIFNLNLTCRTGIRISQLGLRRFLKKQFRLRFLFIKRVGIPNFDEISSFYVTLGFWKESLHCDSFKKEPILKSPPLKNSKRADSLRLRPKESSQAYSQSRSKHFIWISETITRGLLNTQVTL